MHGVPVPFSPYRIVTCISGTINLELKRCYLPTDWVDNLTKLKLLCRHDALKQQSLLCRAEPKNASSQLMTSWLSKGKRKDTDAADPRHPAPENKKQKRDVLSEDTATRDS